MALGLAGLGSLSGGCGGCRVKVALRPARWPCILPSHVVGVTHPSTTLSCGAQGGLRILLSTFSRQPSNQLQLAHKMTNLPSLTQPRSEVGICLESGVPVSDLDPPSREGGRKEARAGGRNATQGQGGHVLKSTFWFAGLGCTGALTAVRTVLTEGQGGQAGGACQGQRERMNQEECEST